MRQLTIALSGSFGAYTLSLIAPAVGPTGKPITTEIELSETLTCSHQKALGFAQELTGTLCVLNPGAAVILSDQTQGPSK